MTDTEKTDTEKTETEMPEPETSETTETDMPETIQAEIAPEAEQMAAILVDAMHRKGPQHQSRRRRR